ncbi:hypothetical protein FQN54_003480 [Arachnomyces sp. PD_36]|nr:hypothetical protein FQN54_003480 [Arachnomyces sp. PD_36]
MAENIPPAVAAAAANPNEGLSGGSGGPVGGTDGTQNNSNPSRGIPYYEKLRRELKDTLQRKRLMDKSMTTLEESIFHYEQSYLEETGAGNIIKGFDNYIKGSTATGGANSNNTSGLGSIGGGAGRRKGQVADQDRVFSRSSASFMRDSPAPSSAQSTPSHQTPRSSSQAPGSGPATNNNSKEITTANTKTTNKKKKSTAASTAGDSSRVRGRSELDDGTDGADGPSNKPPTKRLKISYSRDG